MLIDMPLFNAPDGHNENNPIRFSHLEVYSKRGNGQDANGIETRFAARFRIAG